MSVNNVLDVNQSNHVSNPTTSMIEIRRDSKLKREINGGLAPNKREEERIKGWTVDKATQMGEGQGIGPKISKGAH